MGLRDILTKPMGFGSARFWWKEPMLYKIRLRGDFWLRLAVVFGAWGAATGILWALFANNIHRPGLGLGIGIGSIGGLVAIILVFFLRDHVSGRVSVENEGIRRYRTYGGLTPESWAEWQEWPFAAIGRCSIIPAATLRKSFSVMLLAVGDDREIVGVPQSVDIPKLTKHLARHGVTVSPAKGIPPQFTPRLHIAVASIVPIAGLLSLLGGLTLFLWVRGDVMGDRLDRVQVAQVQNSVENRDYHVNHAVPASDPTVIVVLPEQHGFGLPASGSPSQPEPGAVKHRKGEIIGGDGGFEFSRIGTEGKHVLGFRSNFGQWAGKQWVGRLEPLYGGEPTLPGWETVTARPGYAVGGLHLDTPEFVNAYSVIFMRIRTDGTLDVEDAYSSDWIGPKSNSPSKSLSGGGAIVAGIHGRAGAILNAVGLVLLDN
jgi:hypothetical protein